MQAQADSDDEEGGYDAQQLEGMKVRTDVGDLGDGDTIIVTLADKGILDERGNLVDAEDELENVLAVRSVHSRGTQVPLMAWSSLAARYTHGPRAFASHPRIAFYIRLLHRASVRLRLVHFGGH